MHAAAASFLRSFQMASNSTSTRILLVIGWFENMVASGKTATRGNKRALAAILKLLEPNSEIISGLSTIIDPVPAGLRPTSVALPPLSLATATVIEIVMLWTVQLLNTNYDSRILVNFACLWLSAALKSAPPCALCRVSLGQGVRARHSGELFLAELSALNPRTDAALTSQAILAASVRSGLPRKQLADLIRNNILDQNNNIYAYYYLFGGTKPFKTITPAPAPSAPAPAAPPRERPPASTLTTFLRTEYLRDVLSSAFGDKPARAGLLLCHLLLEAGLALDSIRSAVNHAFLASHQRPQRTWWPRQSWLEQALGQTLELAQVKINAQI